MKWSATQSESKPTSSASRAIASEVGPARRRAVQLALGVGEQEPDLERAGPGRSHRHSFASRFDSGGDPMPDCHTGIISVSLAARSYAACSLARAWSRGLESVVYRWPLTEPPWQDCRMASLWGAPLVRNKLSAYFVQILRMG